MYEYMLCNSICCIEQREREREREREKRERERDVCNVLASIVAGRLQNNQILIEYSSITLPQLLD